jgi:hypothetical protein
MFKFELGIESCTIILLATAVLGWLVARSFTAATPRGRLVAFLLYVLMLGAVGATLL